MKKYILNRLGLSVVTMFIVATIVFFLTHILPGNVARRYLGKSATAEDLVKFNSIAPYLTICQITDLKEQVIIGTGIKELNSANNSTSKT